ncbi:unnamed protein product [Trichobilharzia regenti]|nr:unnamed protein product [Trichobilharzia regenti]
MMPSADETCVNYSEQQRLPPSGVSENTNMPVDYQNQYAFRVPAEASNWMSMNSSANSFHSDVYNHPSQPNPTPQSVYTGPPVPTRIRPSHPPGVTKEATVFYCEFCKVTCASTSSYKEHEDGHRHKRRVLMVGTLKKTACLIEFDCSHSLVHYIRVCVCVCVCVY